MHFAYVGETISVLATAKLKAIVNKYNVYFILF